MLGNLPRRLCRSAACRSVRQPRVDVSVFADTRLRLRLRARTRRRLVAIRCRESCHARSTIQCPELSHVPTMSGARSTWCSYGELSITEVMWLGWLCEARRGKANGQKPPSPVLHTNSASLRQPPFIQTEWIHMPRIWSVSLLGCSLSAIRTRPPALILFRVQQVLDAIGGPSGAVVDAQALERGSDERLSVGMLQHAVTRIRSWP